jgi:hypothetical protein
LPGMGGQFVRNKHRIIILLLGIFFTISCFRKDDTIGKWADNIKLSKKSVDLKAETDSVIITTKGDGWWVDGISFEGSRYSYYHREDINLESDSYLIKEDCFVVERRHKNTLFVKLNKNCTGHERIMTISLEAGDYFDGVTVKQAAN